jgi:hypothetical protein
MWLQIELGRKLDHNHKIDKYNVDGFDSTTNTVYEMYGCFWHGCDICYEETDVNTRTGQEMKELLAKTKQKEDILIQLGYRVVSKWECQFKQPPSNEITGIIKQNNSYKMISNGKFSFKDIMAFLGPGTSYDSFLKAFDTTIPKGAFCHQLTQNLRE